MKYMGILDKFLDAIKLNDDFDDEDDFLDDDFEDDDFEDEKPKRRFFGNKSDDFDDFDDKPSKTPVKENKSYNKATAATSSSTYKRTNTSKVTPMRKKSAASMEVNVIRPTSMEDARDIAETLMNNCTEILNLEGLDVEVAQRIIDFTCGACYALGGSLQKISGYIYILTPAGVDISGDFQEILNGSLDAASMKSAY